MISKRFALLVGASLLSLNLFAVKEKVNKGAQMPAYNKDACKNEEDCLNNDECLCYCSVECGFRKKEFDKGDRPVYKDGICWCKEWDYENYQKRHCDVKEKAKKSGKVEKIEKPGKMKKKTKTVKVSND